MERDDVEETLQAVDGLWDLDLLGQAGLELLIVRVADDDWLSSASNNYRMLEGMQITGSLNETYLVGRR